MRVGLIATALSVADAPFLSSDHLFKRSGGNTGNFAFVNALYQLLVPKVQLFQWHVQPSVVNEQCDVVVIACANQLGKHTDLGELANNLDQIKKPILAIGLGAQSADTSRDVELTSGTKRWLEVIAAHSPNKHPNIGVRGEYTLGQLSKLGFSDRCMVTGCPSNFTNPTSQLGAQIESRRRTETIKRIAVPAGLHLWPSLQNVEENLADLVELSDGEYVAQSELDMIRLAQGEYEEIKDPVLQQLNAYIRPHLSRTHFLEWCRRYMTVYIDAASWIQGMRKFDFVVGPRFHGVMMGIQAGVPGGVIAHDSRTAEMCRTTLIPYVLANSITTKLEAADLHKTFEFQGAAFDKRRSDLAKNLVGILKQASISTSPNLLALAEATAPEGVQLSLSQGATA